MPRGPSSFAGLKVFAGDTEIRIPVELEDDDNAEGVESFELTLEWSRGDAVPYAWRRFSDGPVYRVTHLILDDDCVSRDPSVAEYDRRDVSMRLESQGADGDWGP